jgi:AraC-like DNA-binding protein
MPALIGRPLRAKDVARRYVAFREEPPGPVLRREGPGRDAVLVLSFGTTWRIASLGHAEAVTHHSFVGGLHETAVETRHAGSGIGIEVDLLPLGAYRLLRVPMNALAGRTVDVSVLLRQGAVARLEEQLTAQSNWDGRFGLIDRFLAEAVESGASPSPEILWAWRRLERSHGRIRIRDLTDATGWSRKRLIVRFREEIGIPPKRFARLLRFEHARAMLHAHPERTLAEVAAAAGFYDQSHFATEARRITGYSLTELRSEDRKHFSKPGFVDRPDAKRDALEV